jgi:hypothetical protein
MRRTGDLVAVKDFEGTTLIRRIVSIEGDVLLVCTDEEYAAARREKRTPVSIGFKAAYVVPGPELPWQSKDVEGRHRQNSERHKS